MQMGAQCRADTADESDGNKEVPAGTDEANLNSSSHSTKRRKIASREPTLDEIEAEFWRIVESPDEVMRTDTIH